MPTDDTRPSMRCVCGHRDTEHAAFTGNITPGVTRTLCDHCDCRHWMTPDDRLTFIPGSPLDLLSPEKRRELWDHLRADAKSRRLAAAEARRIPLP